jgi:hypothetical protein
MKTFAPAETDTHLQNLWGATTCQFCSATAESGASRRPCGRDRPCLAAVSQPLSPSHRTSPVKDDPATAEAVLAAWGL